jgi:hypothetical protein
MNEPNPISFYRNCVEPEIVAELEPEVRLDTFNPNSGFRIRVRFDFNPNLTLILK